MRKLLLALTFTAMASLAEALLHCERAIIESE